MVPMATAEGVVRSLIVGFWRGMPRDVSTEFTGLRLSTADVDFKCPDNGTRSEVNGELAVCQKLFAVQGGVMRLEKPRDFI